MNIYELRKHHSGCAVEIFTIEDGVENVIGVYKTQCEQVNDVVE